MGSWRKRLDFDRRDPTCPRELLAPKMRISSGIPCVLSRL